MNNNEIKKEKLFYDIDFSNLMDLRVDYAFKLVFGSKDARFLISLLNSIFANKKLPRKIEALTIIDPHLKKRSEDDKLSIMDLRAQLDDGTTVLIEMHLYDLIDLKYKTIRSWARVYGEELKAGNAYLTQPPVVCVAFAGGSLDGVKSKKVHKCCMITDIDDHTVFTDALQLHYINMKAFVESVNQKGGIRNSEAPDTMLQKWLTVITQNEIADKTIIQNICEQEEEIGMVVSELARLSEDTVVRQQYQSRQEFIMLYNKRINDLKSGIEMADQMTEIANQMVEKEMRRAEKEMRRAEKEMRRAEKASQRAEKESQRAEKERLRAEQAEKDLADQAKIIAELRSQLAKNTEH